MNEALNLKTGFTSYAVAVPADDFLPCDTQRLLRIIAQNAPVLKKALGVKGLRWFG